MPSRPLLRDGAPHALQALDGIERPLTALGRVKCFPRCISDGYVQQSEQWRQHRFQRTVEHQELARQAITNLARNQARRKSGRRR